MNQNQRLLRVILTTIACCVLAVTGIQATARAWGAKGHHIINRLAAEALPSEVPAFMRTPAAIDQLEFLGLELDLLKGAGTAWDSELDPGHYLDLIGNGRLEGGLRLSALPETRGAYDTALRAHGFDQYKVGYLPYSIVEGWQQLRMEFAYWRVDDYESRRAKIARLRAIAAERRSFDEQLIRSDAGTWGHYIADASQPLHVTVHFNGWGNYPNPNHFSNSKHLHDLFETDFVNRFVTMSAVKQYVAPLSLASPTRLTSQATIMNAVERYLAASNATVSQLYQIEKSGGFRTDSAQAKAFTEQRLAFGAGELRTLIVWAWQDSLNETIGDDAPQRVRDIVGGVTPYKGL